MADSAQIGESTRVLCSPTWSLSDFQGSLCGSCAEARERTLSVTILSNTKRRQKRLVTNSKHSSPTELESIKNTTTNLQRIEYSTTGDPRQTFIILYVLCKFLVYDIILFFIYFMSGTSRALPIIYKAYSM